MKLGILVVYLVSDENEWLLDLHLRQIEQHTTVPYQIYGSANRLLPRFREKLEQNQKVTLCEVPTSDLQSSSEHSYYLEHLLRFAISDGASHLATLHVDSFPVHPGWVETIIEKLSAGSVMVAIMPDAQVAMSPQTSCMVFHKDFFLEYKPALRLTEEQISSPQYSRYSGDFPHVSPSESGVGYGYEIYSRGLSWHPLLRSNKGNDHDSFGGIYGDLVFHLGAAAQAYKNHPLKSRSRALRARRMFSSVLSKEMRARIRIATPEALTQLIAPELLVWRRQYEHVRGKLQADPDAYIHFLRTGIGPD